MLRSLPSTHTEGIFYHVFFKNATDEVFFVSLEEVSSASALQGPGFISILVFSFSRFVLYGPWAIRNSGPDGKLLLEQVREGQSILELQQNERKTGKTGERNKHRGKEGEC